MKSLITPSASSSAGLAVDPFDLLPNPTPAVGLPHAAGGAHPFKGGVGGEIALGLLRQAHLAGEGERAVA
ncbi:MAG: hypothetical protein MUC46_09740 [Desulfobacterales bacterium]|nr:hypothetical protein [Desulfobacterales bacterium]